MSKLDEIRQSLEDTRFELAGSDFTFSPGECCEKEAYFEDVSYLLERIEHLERENKRLRSYERSWVAEHYGEEG